MTKVPVPVSMAVLYQQQSFLMQLRDDKDNILYPGKWGLFGGHLEPEELPQAGLIREVKEEINYSLKEPILFRSYCDSRVARYIYFAPLEVGLADLELNEGQDFALVPLSNVRLGYYYSNKLAKNRYLGDIHRQILLDFANYAQAHLVDFK